MTPLQRELSRLAGELDGAHAPLLSEMRSVMAALVVACEALNESEAIIRGYAMARRDTSFPDWELEWREIEIQSESDYEFYPNHVTKEEFARFVNYKDKITKLIVGG